MAPPLKKRKVEQDSVKELPLNSVLEWFDTTTKPEEILAREKERSVLRMIINYNNRQSRSSSTSVYITVGESLSIYVDPQELGKPCY